MFDQQGGFTFQMFDHESYELSLIFWYFIRGFSFDRVAYEASLGENGPS